MIHPHPACILILIVAPLQFKAVNESANSDCSLRGVQKSQEHQAITLELANLGAIRLAQWEELLHKDVCDLSTRGYF
jgi:hypothetical protein